MEHMFAERPDGTLISGRAATSWARRPTVIRIKPDETIWLSAARKVWVVDVVDLEPGETYAGLLRVASSS